MPAAPRAALALALLAACTGGGASPKDAGAGDGDGDGYAPPVDCDDADPGVYPGARDAPYDGVDADCAGDSDEDADGDGVERALDCDDGDPAVFPGAAEACNRVDDDCDGDVDQGAPGAATWFRDADGDGAGDAAEPLVACEQPDGTSPRGDDCDDGDAFVRPGGPERCDDRDDDCDGAIDDGLAVVTVWPDADGDGFGDAAAAPVATCLGVRADQAEAGGDCADGDPRVFPGATPVACNGVDDDCDPATEEPGAVTVDGVPAPDLATALATAPAGAVVALCEGRYVGPFAIVTPLTLTGAGAAFTTLDGASAGPVLAVDADAAVLGGLRLAHGTGRDASGTRQGGGLRIGPGATVAATDLVVAGNTAGEGAGVWLGDDAELRLDGGAVTDNVADPALALSLSLGGGVWAGERARLDLDDVAIARNTADACAGVALSDDGVLDGHGTTAVDANTDGGLGGGGMCAGRGVAVSDLAVTGNHASNVGGGVTAAGGTYTRVVFTGNSADLSGGALFDANADEVRLVDCTIEGNSAALGGGGLAVSGRVVVEGGAVRFNTEASFGASGGGAEVALDGVLESVGAEWRANADADVGLGAASVSYGGVVDFVCDGTAAVCY